MTFGISISMCKLAQSYRQNDMETILPSKESVNDVEPAGSIYFLKLGGGQKVTTGRKLNIHL